MPPRLASALLACAALCCGADATGDARRLWQEGRREAAIETLRRAGESARPGEDVLWLRVHYLAESGRAGEALAAAAQSIDRAPASRRLKQIYTYLLTTTVARGDAEATLQTLVEQHPREPVYKLALGRMLFERNALDAQALRLLGEAAAGLRDDPEARYMHAQALCESNQHAACVAELEAALKLTPGTNAQAQMQMNAMTALAEESLKHPERAAAAWERAITANRSLAAPSDATEFRYIEFLLRNGRASEVPALLDRILARNPRFAQARIQRAVMLEQEDKLDEALVEAEQALRDARGGPKQLLRQIHAALAKILFQLGREDDAARYRTLVEAEQ